VPGRLGRANRQILRQGRRRRFLIEYDFGDDWRHTIALEGQWLGGAYDAQAFSASDVTFDDPTARWRQAFLD